MGSSSTPENTGSVQAAPLGTMTAGDGTGGSGNEAGQGDFSMPIVPDGSATAKQSKGRPAGAGTPPTAGEKTIFEGAGLEGKEGAAKTDQNAQNKGQRNEQAGWQNIVETLGKVNERLDKMEQSNTVNAQTPKEENKETPKEAEAMNKLAETLAATNSRLERMEFERDNPDLLSKELTSEWKKVNSDTKFEKFSLDERAQHVRGIKGKAQVDTMRDQLSRAEGSMPRGAGGSGPSAQGGNPLVDDETVAVGAAFGFSRQDLEKELS